MTDPQRYRVFICYAHENEDELKLVVEHLWLLGVQPRWSGTLQAGSPFPGQIKDGISRAHLFLSILTATANARLWVHQEIGFALAANVPLCRWPSGNFRPVWLRRSKRSRWRRIRIN